MSRITRFLKVKFHMYNPLGCLASPRDDLLAGFAKWKWLRRQRKSGRLVDPSVEIRSACRDLDGLARDLIIGKGSAIDKGCIFWVGDETGLQGKISLGERVYIGPYSFIGSCHQLSIGDCTLIGAHSYLITANHKTTDKLAPYVEQGYEGGDISLGHNVWLGTHVVVLPGVSIGDNSIVGAGSVVTRSIPANEKWAGVPARKINDI